MFKLTVNLGWYNSLSYTKPFQDWCLIYDRPVEPSTLDWLHYLNTKGEA